jgi:hypothetical protein
MVHSVSSISSFVGIFTCSQAKWIRSRDVPASLESLLPSSHLAKPSRVFHAHAHQQTLNFTSSNDSLTHYSSAIIHHIPYPFTTTYRSLDKSTTAASPSLLAQSLHLAAAAASPTATPPRARPRPLARLLSLISGTRKTRRLARQRAVGSMITNLLLQTTRVVRFASLCELLNATSTQASKILIIMLLQPE